jgi:hypothetical protein
MVRKATLGGLAAVVLAAGGAGVMIANAASASSAPPVASSSPTGSPSGSPTGSPAGTATGSTDTTAKAGKHDGTALKALLGKLKNFEHAEWVTKGDANTNVTHEAIFGQVAAVSSTSITIKSTDGTSMTFAVNDKTVVHEKAVKGGTAPANPSIADVKTGESVLVAGEKSPDLIAKNVVARAR